MGMRITTNMMRRNYTNSLMGNIGGLEKARRQVETGRRFESSYEDPSAAAKGMILERRNARNADYTNTVKTGQKWIDGQSDVLNELSKYANQIDESEFTAAMNDPTGQVGRAAYAQNLRELQQSMVKALNTQYGDTFLMAGTDGRNVPFDLKDDGTLTYQGKDVNDAEAMKELANQNLYVDIGFGLTFYSEGDQAGDIVPSSAFDMAFPGILAVGYGTSQVEVPGKGTIEMSNNIIVLAGQMADALEAEDGEIDRDLCNALWDQFKGGREELQDQFARVGTKAQLLDNTLTRLETDAQNILEQYQDAIGIDPALAITNESYAMYSYNAALKIGTSLLGNSLLDFMS